MVQKTQQRDPRLLRGTKAVLCGLTTFSLVAGLGLIRYDAKVALADECGEAVVEHIGSDEVSAEEAMARAEAVRDEEVPEEVVRGELLVEMLPGSDEVSALSVALGNSGMRIEEKVMDGIGDLGTIYLVSVPGDADLAEAKAHILENTQVASVSYNTILQTDGTFEELGEDAGNQADVVQAESSDMAEAEALANDPGKSSKWEVGTSFLNFEGAWQAARNAGWTDSSNVTIALMDTGIMATHEDLADNIAYQYNAGTQSSSNMTDEASDGHGTAVAGIASARTNNGKGTCSLAYNAKLLPIKVFVQTTNSQGQSQYGAPFSYVLSAMNWLVTENPSMGGQTPAQKYNVKVVNLSVGYPTSMVDSDKRSYLDGGITKLWNNGIVLTNSMGNNVLGDTALDVPYDHWPTSQSKDKCVGVIALKKDSDSTMVLDHQSNYNLSESASDLVGKVSAPGRNIYTTSKTGTGAYVSSFSGTSAATPQVASLLALMFSIYPSMTPTQATNILYQNPKAVSGTNKTQKYVGYGSINPVTAVQKTIALKESSSPSYASQSELQGMTASIGGTAVSGFSIWDTSYTKDFGTVTSTPNTAVTFTNAPSTSQWTKSETSNTTDQTVTDSLGRTVKNYTKVTAVTFTSTRNSAQGSPVVVTYTFTMRWSVITNDPDANLVAQLNGMTASVGGTQLDGFTYTTLDYSKNYNRIAATQQLPSKVDIALPSGASWTVQANPSNPLVDTDKKQVATDGTTTGTRTRKFEYTLTSTTNGAMGSPLTRKYTFTFTGSYEDTSTRYTTVLKDIKLTIDGKEYDKFNVGTKSYSIKVDDIDALDGIEAPEFTNLPDGWTQQASSPKDNATTTDNGDGTTTKRTTKTYTITLSNGQGGKVTYTVTLYAESTYDTPKPEAGDSGQSGQSGQQGQQQQQQQQTTQQTTQQTQQQTTQQTASGTSSGTQQGTNNASNQQRQTTGQDNIVQTGDATAIVAIASAAAAAIGLATSANRRKNC